MTHVITSACTCTKDESCVAACPVDCILGDGEQPMLFIDPALCIDCGACIPVCPVKAIYEEAAVPEPEQPYIEINRLYFTEKPVGVMLLKQQLAARVPAQER